MKWLEGNTHSLVGLNAPSGIFANNLDKKQMWLTTYTSGSVAGIPW
jgi:hypothetical protein